LQKSPIKETILCVRRHMNSHSCFIHMCGVTHSYARLIPICDSYCSVTHECDFMCVAWLPLSWVTLHIRVTYRNEPYVGMSHGTHEWNTCHATHTDGTHTNETHMNAHTDTCHTPHLISFFTNEKLFFFEKEFAPTTLLTRMYAHTDTCDITLTCETWLIHTCDTTHSCVRHDSFMCATWLIHVRSRTQMCLLHIDCSNSNIAVSRVAKTQRMQSVASLFPPKIHS